MLEFTYSARSHAFMYVHSLLLYRAEWTSTSLYLLYYVIIMSIYCIAYYVDTYLSMVCSSYKIGSMKLIFILGRYESHTTRRNAQCNMANHNIFGTNYIPFFFFVVVFLLRLFYLLILFYPFFQNLCMTILCIVVSFWHASSILNCRTVFNGVKSCRYVHNNSLGLKFSLYAKRMIGAKFFL